MPSTFADRLWWSRHRAGLGATRLARLVKCSQSLISALERNNAEKSKLSNDFAKVLKVDPTWLAFGVTDRAPPGFDEETARRGRMGQAVEPGVVGEAGALAEPRWAEPLRPPASEPLAPLTGADALMKGLVNSFMDFARLAGTERAIKLLETFRHIVGLVSHEETLGQDQVGSTDQGHNRAGH